MAIRIGCGSWADQDYVGLLYPKGLPSKERLGTYAQWFERVEVNSSYYVIPSPATVAGWVKQTPPKFLFDIKLPRAFSQGPAKAASGPAPARLLPAIQPLLDAGKFGVFLLTLAPFFGPPRRQLDDIDAVAEKLTPHLLAVEFRHRGWVDGDALAATLEHFRKRKLVWVALDLPRLKHSSILPPIDEVTNPRLAYMRLHGRNPKYLKAKSAADRHHYAYKPAELRQIAARIQALAKHAKNVHVSVNNHSDDFAPKAALALRKILGQKLRSPARYGLPPYVT